MTHSVAVNEKLILVFCHWPRRISQLLLPTQSASDQRDYCHLIL